MNRQQGFTLVEMLVAGAIMMAVLLIATSAYSFFADRWQADGQAQRHHFAVKRSQMMLSEVMKARLPYLVKTETGNQYLFEGSQEQLTFVTAKPIFSSGIALINLEVIPVGDGSYQLRYLEAPIEDTKLALTGERPDFVYEKIVFEDASVMGFRFFGWDNIRSRNLFLDDGVGKPSWMSEVNSEESGIMPTALAFTLDDEVLRILLPSDEGKSRGWSRDSDVDV